MAERVVKTRLTVVVSDYEKGMMAAAAATRTVGTEAEKLAQKKQAFEQVGRGLVLTGAALTAVTALSVKAAIDWESAWAGVTKTVDGNAQQMGELEDGLRSLATTLPATHDEIAAVAEAAGQLGVSRESIVDFTKTMVDLSETTNLTADEAATSIAQLMNVMQTAPDEVDNLGAALVALGNDGASTERDIIQMAQRIAGAGKIVGLTEPQVLGFANALASVGIEAEAGGSAISRIMTDIAMSVSTGGEKLDEFAKVAGMSSADFQKAFKEAPAEAIATFVEGLGRIDESGGDVFQTLSNLGQTDIRVSQALLGMANSGDLLRRSLDLGSAAWDENTALAVEAAKRYETTEAKIKIAGNAVRDAAIDFGQVFLPAVAAASEGLAEFAGFLGDLPDPVQGLLGILTASVGILALVGGTALLAVPKIAEFKVALDTLGISMRTIGILGGGALIALTALVTVVGAVASAQANAAAKAEAYADTLAESTNKITSATRDMVKENLAASDSFLWMERSSAYDKAEELGLSLDSVTDAALGNVEALQQLKAAQEEYQAAVDADKDRGDTTSIDDTRLASINAVIDAVKGENSSIEESIRVAQQKKTADESSAEGSKTAAAAYLDEAGAVEDLEGELSSLIDTINEANGINQDAVSANANYQQALAGISEEVTRQKEAYEAAHGSLDGFNLSLDENTASGAANAASLTDVAAAAQSAAESQYQVDLTTMSAKDATDKYYTTLQSQRQAFIDSAIGAGYNADQVQILADKVFALPSEKEVAIIAETAAAQSKVDQFVTLNSGRRVKVFVDAEGGQSYKVGSITVSPGMAAGGPVIGRGSKGIDSELRMLAPGEHVITAGEVDAAGGHREIEQFRDSLRSGSVGSWMSGRQMGLSQQVAAPSVPSLDGLSITGTLEIGGDGLARIINGHLRAKDDADTAWSRGGVRD